MSQRIGKLYNIELETKSGSIASKGFDFQKACLLYEILKYKDDFVYGFFEMTDDLLLIKVNDITQETEWIKIIQVKGKYIYDEHIIDIKENRSKRYIKKFLENINNKMIEHPKLKFLGSYIFSGILKYYNNDFKSGTKICDIINKHGNDFKFKTYGNFEIINKLTSLDYHDLNGNNFLNILINPLNDLSKYPSVIESHDLIISMLIGAVSKINDKLLIKVANIQDFSTRDSITFSNIKDYILKIDGGVQTNYEMIKNLIESEKYRFLEEYSCNDFSIMLRKLNIYVVEFKLSINSPYDKIFNKIHSNIISTKDDVYWEIFKSFNYEELDKYKKLWLYFESLIILEGFKYGNKN